MAEEPKKRGPREKGPRRKAKLTPLEVEKSPAGRYCDGDGLWLHKDSLGTGRWVLRYMLRGHSREMGLGSFRTFSLKEARRLAREQRQMIEKDIDPIDARKEKITQAKLAKLKTATFSECAGNLRKNTAQNRREI